MVGRLGLLAAAAVAVVGFGSCAGAAAPARSTRATAREPLLGLLQAPSSSVSLARLDPLSLRPVSRHVEIGEYHHAWSLSPDGSRVALGRGGQGIGIDIVDLQAMRVVREIQTGIAAEALGWLAPRLLVAGLQRGGTVLVDPETGAILRRWRAFSFPDASARVGDGLVMLFSGLSLSGLPSPIPRNAISATPRLALVDAQGRLRSVVLTRIRLAARLRSGMYYADRAGLAVDPAQARAYVFAADAPVAEVDLRLMRVSYHPFERPRRNVLLARQRGALWLGSGQVALFGRDFVAAGGRAAALRPAGATLVNTEAWSRRTLDRRTTGAAFAAGRVVVYGPGWYPALGEGLRAYALDGHRVFSLFTRKRVLDVQVAADLAYVRAPRAVYVVDVEAGRILTKIVPPRDLVDVITPPS